VPPCVTGFGTIRGNFTGLEADAIAHALKAEPLPVTPMYLRQEPADL
jgi:hypothetical protein